MKNLTLSICIVALLILSSCSTQSPAPTATQSASDQVQGSPVQSSSPTQKDISTPQSVVPITPVQTAPNPIPAKASSNNPSTTDHDQSTTSQSNITFSIIAKNFDFTPATIKVKKGDHVILRVKSTDITHGFALPEFGINQPLKPGEEQTIEFDATKSGNFEFFCSIYCGSGHNDMKGTLIVEE